MMKPMRSFSGLLTVLFLAAGVNARASTLGIYVDATGSSCSFSGNAQGNVTAYVVVKPDNAGIQSVRFAAPLPACFGGVYLYEAAPDGAAAIGNSQSGVSVAFPFCATQGSPAVVLEVHYYRSSSTTPCCAVPIVADPFVGAIEATDCAFNPAAITPLVSHFNADASCPCLDASAPAPPTNPSPANNADLVGIGTSLQWLSSDADIINYDVYLGTNPTPGLVATVAQPAYQPASSLQELTQYYWRIVERDVDGLETSGPVWSFTTRVANSPPSVPGLTYPSNGTGNIPLDISLQWASSDVDGDALTYDLYFGAASDPPLLAAGLAATSYSLPTLMYGTTYRWKVIAIDGHGHETASMVASFTSRPLNYPPNVPSSPTPANFATDRSPLLMLSWQATDPENDAMTFDLYFGTSATPPLVAANLGTKSYAIEGLNFVTNYYWQVACRDIHGGVTTGPVWRFETRANALPDIYNWSPEMFATNVSINVTLIWKARDADYQPLTFDVYFGAVPYPADPPLVASNVANSFYNPGPLQYGTHYRWKVIPRDPYAAGWGPTADFTTASTATAAGSQTFELALGSAYPNPFNPRTAIPYTVPTGPVTRVRLTIYDTSGHPVRVLVDEAQRAGAREAVWTGEDDKGGTVSSGIYYCVLRAGNERRTQKLVLLK